MFVFIHLIYCFLQEALFGKLNVYHENNVSDVFREQNIGHRRSINSEGNWKAGDCPHGDDCEVIRETPDTARDHWSAREPERSTGEDLNGSHDGGHHSDMSQTASHESLVGSSYWVDSNSTLDTNEESTGIVGSPQLRHNTPGTEATSMINGQVWPENYGYVNSTAFGLGDAGLPTHPKEPDIADYTVYCVSERDWLNKFEILFYAENMVSDLKALIRKAIGLSKDPFSFALYTARHAEYDLYKYSNKKSLPYLIMAEFESWIQERTTGKTTEEVTALGLEPTNQHKDLALEIVVTERLFLFEPVKRIYKLDSQDNVFLDQHLRFLLHSKKKYKEAATFVCKLHLQRVFDVSEILVPLVIFDKLQLAESYLAGCPALQKEFLVLLDEFCGMTEEELEDIVERTVFPKPKEHRLKIKTLIKLAERLVKLFNLKAEDYPNVYREKNMNGLKYLLHKKYSERGSSSRKWDDLLETAIGNQQWLQVELVKNLSQCGDVAEATRWAQYYDLPLDHLPRKVHELVQSWRQQHNEDEDWEGEMRGTSVPRCPPQRPPSPTVQYLQLPLPPDRILLVRDSQALEGCLRTIKKTGGTVGFDAEWRPVMCRAGTDARLAIIQLATWRRVFILDMIALPENVGCEQLSIFAFEVFANPQILKLGYGIESDFQVLTSSCPPFKGALDEAARFVDLCPLSKEILRLPSVQRRVRAKGRLSPGQRGLTELVYYALGLPLDKTCQITDWERRPLSTEQLHYAALDAFCLLETYEVLKCWVKESGIAVDLEPRLEWQKPEKQKRKDSRRRQTKLSVKIEVPVNPARRSKPITPRALAVVVDTMLQGLGRQLQACGVDVVILENGSDHTKTAEIAQRENRAILTAGTPYKTLLSAHNMMVTF